ncbi:MAG TPA: aldo/keto reductase [Syntrophorhabdaceae bacterium]|nr:aldo/keto reductase [Syntrophorhabdaceae bacterium]
MEYVRLNNVEDEISAVTLGTWAIGGSHWGQYDEANAILAIEAALDNGINAIDTAPVYGDGHAEELVGKAIRGRRDKVFLATKCGLNIYARTYERDLSPSYIETDLNGSLKRLGTDYIDLYQCHWPDPKTPIEETMAALARFRQQGKIRHIGVSNFSASELREALRTVPLFSLQPHYSLLERSCEKDLLPVCVGNGMNVIPYGCLGAGMLTGKYKECPKFTKGDARSFFYRFFKPKYWLGVRRLIDAVEEIAMQRNVRPGAVALSWLLARPGVKSVIVGARSALQATENIADIPTVLSEDDLQILEELSRKVYNS